MVSEPVSIRLSRPPGSGPTAYFVQCDQADCQYVEANRPPCPLHPGLFSDEIGAADAERAARRDRQ